MIVLVVRQQNVCALETEVQSPADWFGKAIEKRETFVLTMLQGSIGEVIRGSEYWPRLAALANLSDSTATATGSSGS